MRPTDLGSSHNWNCLGSWTVAPTPQIAQFLYLLYTIFHFTTLVYTIIHCLIRQYIILSNYTKLYYASLHITFDHNFCYIYDKYELI